MSCPELIILCIRDIRVSLVVSNSATPWTVACQAPLSLEFSKQEYWIRLPLPPPGGSPIQASNLHVRHLLCWQVDSSPRSPLESPVHPGRAVCVSRGPLDRPLEHGRCLSASGRMKRHDACKELSKAIRQTVLSKCSVHILSNSKICRKLW